jgi:CheY-like chemotaxis protein
MLCFFNHYGVCGQRTGKSMIAAINLRVGVRRVLVVDDNRDAADSLAILLRLWGYDCRACYDGQDALQTTWEFRPDCLILDINMPGMDGCAVARRIRELPELSGIKLVALTAYSDETYARRIREAGFDYRLVKAGNIEKLENLLTMILAS